MSAVRVGVSSGVLADLDLTAVEEQFVKDSRTNNTGEINFSRTVAAIYTVKHLQRQVDQTVEAGREISQFVVEHIETSVTRIIEAQKDLARSTEKHTKAMIALTALLAVASLLQVMVIVAG